MTRRCTSISRMDIHFVMIAVLEVIEITDTLVASTAGMILTLIQKRVLATVTSPSMWRLISKLCFVICCAVIICELLWTPTGPFQFLVLTCLLSCDGLYASYWRTGIIFIYLWLDKNYNMSYSNCDQDHNLTLTSPNMDLYYCKVFAHVKSADVHTLSYDIQQCSQWTVLDFSTNRCIFMKPLLVVTKLCLLPAGWVDTTRA
jgi:hypothetical protein